MSHKQHKPQWWQVYIMLPLLAGLFVLEIRLRLKGTVNILAQLGILFLVYAFMQLWIRANRRALMGLDEVSGEWLFKVYEVTPASLAGAREAAQHIERRPAPQLPGTEVKGVLDTAFEMDEYDAEAPFSMGARSLQAEQALNVKQTKDVDV